MSMNNDRQFGVLPISDQTSRVHECYILLKACDHFRCTSRWHNRPSQTPLNPRLSTAQIFRFSRPETIDGRSSVSPEQQRSRDISAGKVDYNAQALLPKHYSQAPPPTTYHWPLLLGYPTPHTSHLEGDVHTGPSRQREYYLPRQARGVISARRSRSQYKHTLPKIRGRADNTGPSLQRQYYSLLTQRVV